MLETRSLQSMGYDARPQDRLIEITGYRHCRRNFPTRRFALSDEPQP